MQQLTTQITRYVYRIILAVMLLTGTQAYGQIAMGDTSGYSGTSSSSSSYSGYSGTSSSSSSYPSYGGDGGNSSYSNNSNNNSINVSSLSGLTGTSWSNTPSYNGNGVAGYAAANPSSLPSSSSCTGCYSGTATNVSLPGYNGNNSGDISIDVSSLKNYNASSPLLGSISPNFVSGLGVANYVASNPNALPKSNSFGSFSGVASVNPNYGFYSGPFVGPVMDSDIYSPQLQLVARLAGDKIRGVLGRENTLTSEKKYQAEQGLQIADFVAGVGNQLPSGERTAVLDTIWDVGNVIYDAGRYVQGKVTGDQKLVDQAKTDFFWDTAAAAIPFVPAGTTKVVRAADAATNLKKLPDSTVVCRGGSCTAERFTNGNGVSTDSTTGQLNNVSVNIGENFQQAATGIPHPQVGVTTVGDVRVAGGDVVASPTGSQANHATLSGITAQQAESIMKPTVSNPNPR